MTKSATSRRGLRAPIGSRPPTCRRPAVDLLSTCCRPAVDLLSWRMAWPFFAMLGGGITALLLRAGGAQRQRRHRGEVTGLTAIEDLTHLPSGLMDTALWRLSDGGFERCVLHGTISRATSDLEITAFDLETLRERRGEWAYLPVERPFRIRGVVTVAVCELGHRFPHLLCKREGRGDQLLGDELLEREAHLAKSARSRLGLAHDYPAELPPGLGVAARPVPQAEQWRAYTTDDLLFTELVRGGLAAALAAISMRDLVIEIVDNVLVAYPATRDALGVDGFAELCSAATAAAAAVRAAIAGHAPRGSDLTRTIPGARP
jgi:hypothetical protein